jgi:hypothetical protein
MRIGKVITFSRRQASRTHDIHDHGSLAGEIKTSWTQTWAIWIGFPGPLGHSCTWCATNEQYSTMSLSILKKIYVLNLIFKKTSILTHWQSSLAIKYTWHNFYSFGHYEWIKTLCSPRNTILRKNICCIEYIFIQNKRSNNHKFYTPLKYSFLYRACYVG